MRMDKIFLSIPCISMNYGEYLGGSTSRCTMKYYKDLSISNFEEEKG